MLFTFLSLPILLIGFFIYKFKFVELLAGYNNKKVIDKDGLSRWTGINLMLLGITNIVIESIFYALNIDFDHKPIIHIIITFIFVIRIISGTKMYQS